MMGREGFELFVLHEQRQQLPEMSEGSEGP